MNVLNPVKPSKLAHDDRSLTKLISYTTTDFRDLKGKHSTYLQFVIDCLNCNIPILLVTNDPQRSLENLQSLAKISGQKLNRILLNDRSDTSQLLGCFEQTASDISAFLKELDAIKDDSKEQSLVAEINDLEYNL